MHTCSIVCIQNWADCYLGCEVYLA